MRFPVFRVLLPALVAAFPLSAQRFVSSGFSDKTVFEFFQKLQVAIVNNNHAVIAGLVQYPLMVNRGGEIHRKIETREQLLRSYDSIFTPAIRQAIILEKQAKLFGNEQGVAIARGTVWLIGKCDHAHPPTCTLGVGSINLPKPK